MSVSHRPTCDSSTHGVLPRKPATGPEYGAKALRNPDVQARIQVLFEKAAKGITKESVLHGLLREAMYYGEDASHAARVQAWKAIGDALGLGAQHVQRRLHVLGCVRNLDVAQLDALEKLDDEQLVRALETRQLPAARTDGPDEYDA